jgi:energy-coupling factor transport system substrate-specific component
VRLNFRPAFTVRDLVFIGIFASVIKASALLISFAGGGMNPLSLFLKNFIYASLMLVLACKVGKPWTLALATLVSCLVSLLLMGQEFLHAPGALLACLPAELCVILLGGYARPLSPVLGILVLELGAKAASMGVASLHYREQPGMVVPALIFVCIGALGTFGGLAGGVKLVKELRHASIIA